MPVEKSEKEKSFIIDEKNRTFVGNLYKKVKDPNLVDALRDIKRVAKHLQDTEILMSK